MHRLIRPTSRCSSRTPTPTWPIPGVSDALAARARPDRPAPAATGVAGAPAAGEGRGIGRIGALPAPMTLAEFTALRGRARCRRPPWGVRAAGDPERLIRDPRGLRRRGRLLPRRRHRRRRRRVPHRRPAPPPGQRAPRRGRPGAARRRALGDRTAVARRRRGLPARPVRRSTVVVSDLDTDPWTRARRTAPDEKEHRP